VDQIRAAGNNTVGCPMIVSHQRRFIVFHNPKCAGTSLRVALGPYHDDPVMFRGFGEAPFFRTRLDHAHLRLWELQALFPRILAATARYRSVILVRDPLRRFISAVAHHFHYFQPNAPLDAMPPAVQIQTIEAFVDGILTQARIMTDFRYVHFSPQVWFILLGDRRVPERVLPLDGEKRFAAEAFAHLGVPDQGLTVENPARLDLSHIAASPKIASFVRTFYAPDYAFLEADPALRHMVASG
jgi:hypothetical protein